MHPRSIAKGDETDAGELNLNSCVHAFYIVPWFAVIIDNGNAVDGREVAIKRIGIITIVALISGFVK